MVYYPLFLTADRLREGHDFERWPTCSPMQSDVDDVTSVSMRMEHDATLGRLGTAKLRVPDLGTWDVPIQSA